MCCTVEQGLLREDLDNCWLRKERQDWVPLAISNPLPWVNLCRVFPVTFLTFKVPRNVLTENRSSFSSNARDLPLSSWSFKHCRQRAQPAASATSTQPWTYFSSVLLGNPQLGSQSQQGVLLLEPCLQAQRPVSRPCWWWLKHRRHKVPQPHQCTNCQ